VSVGYSTGQAQIAIRGIGFATLNPGDEGRVAYYIDGVYIARPSAQLGSFFDVDRVEVLRGPQGTLYGRNATGGAFNVFARKPTTELSGYLNVTAGNYGLISTNGAISGPLSDTLSARLAFQTTNRGGYGKNLFLDKSINDANTTSGRASLRWKPNDKFDLDLSANYHREHDRNYALLSFGPGTPGVALGAGAVNFSQDIAENEETYNHRHSYGVNGAGTYHLTDEVDFKTIVAYQHSWFDILNGEGSPQPFARSRQHETANQFSTEFQLNGNMDRLKWTVGAYYFHEKVLPENRAAVLGSAFGGPNYVTQGFALSADLTSSALAGFAQANYAITDQLSLTIGGRYSYEKKRDRNDQLAVDLGTPFPAPGVPGGELPIPPLSPPFPLNQSDSFKSFTPKVTVDYKITPQTFVYATYSKGFKSGGFNYATVQQAFLPEKLTNYEVGIKSTMLDNRLRANLSGFIYDYTNIQTQVVSSNPPGVFVQNSGRARIKGLEAEITAKPVSAIQLDLTYGLLDAKFKDFITADPARPALGPLQIGGNRVPQAPKYTLNAGAQYSYDLGSGELTLRGEYHRQGKTYFTIFNTPTAAQRSYEGNDGHWSATAFVRNIGDKFAATSMFIQAAGFGGGLSGSAIAPRTYGATVGYKF
jgi:iron complex outermembrane recepter protein